MPAPPEPPEERRLPEQARLGLLPYIDAHAVDDDYAVAASRHARAGSGARIGLLGAVALAVFATLAVTAAVQTSRDSGADERERKALVAQVRQQQKALQQQRAEITALRNENERLDADRLRAAQSPTGVLAQTRVLALRAGTTPVTGPGVEVTVDDAPDAQSDRDRVLDSDLQKVVNALWAAGAEAISINGQRLTNLTAIRHAGDAITVNYTSLSRPYRILAIGDRDAMPARFANTATGQAWLDLQREVGLRFAMRTRRTLRLPAAEVPDLRYVEEEGSAP